MTDANGKKRILIVDDNEDIRFLLEQILEEEDLYDLSFAENGADALAKTTAFQPHLILMDMSLPGLSGWDVVPQIRKIPAFTRIPIIAVTAHVSLADQERATAVGCNAHLSKPFEVITVIDLIKTLLSR